MMRLIAMHIWFLDELGWTTGHRPATLTPEAVDALMSGRLEAQSLVATHDQTIDPNLERLFALTMNATTVEIPSSHVAMLLHPFEVAAVIRKAAAVRGRAALKGITNETHAGCDL
jgi:hypothetical protein